MTDDNRDQNALAELEGAEEALAAAESCLDPTMDRLLAYMEKDREDTDYDPGATFTREHVEERIASARVLLVAARCRVDANVRS